MGLAAHRVEAVDSPEIGFVFKGPSYTRPAPGPGARLEETIAVLGANVRAEVKLRGEGFKPIQG